MIEPEHKILTSTILGAYILALITVTLFSFMPAVAAADLTVTPLTWNVIGLDSNNVNVGPNDFPVGARVCNAGTDASNVLATFVWEDGQENATAAGDSGDDGIVRSGDWSDGTGNLNVSVAGGRGCLMGWLDYRNGSTPYNPDSDFNDTGETIINNQPVNTGVTAFSFSLPLNAANNAAWFARFRLVPDQDGDGDCTDQSALGLTGLAANGDVDDYYWSFSPTSIQLVELSASPIANPSHLAGPGRRYRWYPGLAWFAA